MLPLVCPHCRRNAPLVYQGISAVCSACGRSRTPLTGSSLTHAGKPARVAGQVVSVMGWLLLVSGLAVAALIALIVGLIGGASGGLITFGVLGAITLLAFFLTRYGSRGLERAADTSQDERRAQAMFELAAHRGGRLYVRDAAQALHISQADADRLLTNLAKERSDEVDLQVTEAGEIYYVFVRYLPYERPAPRVRIGAPPEAAAAELEATAEAEQSEALRAPTRRRV